MKLFEKSRHNVHLVKNTFHTEGISGVIVRAKKALREKLREKVVTGRKYYYSLPEFSLRIQTQMENFPKNPLISIIMPVYNVDPKWLELAIKSVQEQWYINWELCIVDDASTNKKTIDYLKKTRDSKIKVHFSQTNGHISKASNIALSMATGEYVVLMDNDDELTVDALYEIVKCINETEAEFIYSDEDKIEMNGTFCEPHFKPDYSPDLLLSQNYMSHLGVIKKNLIDEVSGFEVGMEGSQDYDLYLKIVEKTNKIEHIPKVLYHWRKIPGSTAFKFSDKNYAQVAGLKALEKSLFRQGIKGKVSNGKYPGTYRIDYEIGTQPLISIIIPFKDKPELLEVCINSIIEKSTYKIFEIIGISNNSIEKRTYEVMKQFEHIDKRIKFYEINIPFNYSKLNNLAVSQYAKGTHILFLNNDIEIISNEWLENLLMFSQKKEIGCVGGKLYYPNDTVQHAGVIIGVLGVAGHSHRFINRNEMGYMYRPHIIQNISAITAALLMVKKELFDSVEGFDDTNLKVTYNDVDFCLKVGALGYKNIFTPYVEAYHHESISRKDIDNNEQNFMEYYFIKKKYLSIIEKGDPYYSKFLTKTKENFDYNLSQNLNYDINFLIGNLIFQNQNPIVLLSHNLEREGAPLLLLEIVRRLSETQSIVLISINGGALYNEFSKYATVIVVPQMHMRYIENEEMVDSAFEILKTYGVQYAVGNTIGTGLFIPYLEKYAIPYKILVHEMPTVLEILEWNKTVVPLLSEIKSGNLVFSSEFVLKEHAKAFSYPMPNVEIIPQGVFSKKEQQFDKIQKHKELCKKLSIPEGSLIIMGGGTDFHRKGGNLFFEIATKINKINSNFIFIFYCSFSDPNYQKFVQNNSDTNIRFLEFSDTDTYLNSLMGSNAFLLSSREDPFPNVFLDSLLFELPFFAFEGCGGAPEVLLKNDLDFCTKNIDTELMSKKILKYFENPQQNYVSETYKKMLKEYDFDNYLAKILIEKYIPKVSVVVPNYNYAHYLPERLSTIIEQSYEPFEIIFLDDCSSDDSIVVAQNILKNCKIPYQIIENNLNSGVYSQWKKGIELAKGELIWIAEADDFSEIQFLEKLTPFFKDPKVNLAFSHTTYADSESKVYDKDALLSHMNSLTKTKYKNTYISDSDIEVHEVFAYRNVVLNTSMCVMRKNAIFPEVLHNLQDYKFAGDWYLYLMMIKNGKVAHNKLVLNHFRRHNQSVTINNARTKGYARDISAIYRMIINNYSMTKREKRAIRKQYIADFGVKIGDEK